MQNMVIEGQYEELDEPVEEFDLSDDDSLPWLEADEEAVQSGGVDTAQLIGFVALLLAVLVGVVGAIWYFSQSSENETIAADGSTIEAPQGSYKDRPGEDERGGREVAGTGNVAPAVAEGQMTEGRIASETGAGAGDQDLAIKMPTIGGAAPIAGSAAASGQTSTIQGSGSAQPSNGGQQSSATANAAANSAAKSPSAKDDPNTPNVQLAAYSSEARAHEGWREIKRRTSALKDVDYRVMKGKADIGTVFRLQALPGSRNAANQLCQSLKGQGIECQVKP